MPSQAAGCDAPSVTVRDPSGRSLERRRASEATETLVASAAGIFDFEAFIESVPFLSPDERNRFKLAGGEIFDNLIRHAEPLAEGEVIVRCARRADGLILAFYFKSPTFGPFAACSSCGRAEPDAALGLDPSSLPDSDAEMAPFFDPLIGRWRGIGIRMCKNLSSSLLLRAGPRLDRIFIALR
jgi:hypothetical protein